MFVTVKLAKEVGGGRVGEVDGLWYNDEKILVKN